MTDPRDDTLFAAGLPRLAFVPVTPASDGFAAAYAEGRRRRRRKGINTSALSAALIIALATTGTLDGLRRPIRLGVDEPRVTNQPDRVDGRIDVVERNEAPASLTTDGTTAGSRLEGGSVFAPIADAPGSGSVSAAEGPAGSGRPGSDPAAARGKSQSAVKHPVRREYRGVGVDNCVLYGQVRGWCMSSSAQRVSSRVFDLHVTVCLDPSAASGGALTYPTGLEADFVVKRAGKAVWQWSRGQFFSADDAHGISMAGGECVNWVVRWDAVDEAGRPLQRGQYTFSALSAANELRTSRTVDRSITVE